MTITPKGRQVFDGVWPEHLKGIERYFSQPLDDDDVMALDQVLGKLIRANEPS